MQKDKSMLSEINKNTKQVRDINVKQNHRYEQPYEINNPMALLPEDEESQSSNGIILTQDPPQPKFISHSSLGSQLISDDDEDLENNHVIKAWREFYLKETNQTIDKIHENNNSPSSSIKTMTIEDALNDHRSAKKKEDEKNRKKMLELLLNKPDKDDLKKGDFVITSEIIFEEESTRYIEQKTVKSKKEIKQMPSNKDMENKTKVNHVPSSCFSLSLFRSLKLRSNKVLPFNKESDERFR